MYRKRTRSRARVHVESSLCGGVGESREVSQFKSLSTFIAVEAEGQTKLRPCKKPVGDMLNTHTQSK